jgi:LAO/AO transport system kinase
LLRALFPLAGKARTVGITGPAGAGKSTLVDQFTRELRKRGRKVGILAVDPSSAGTGGALLGDRIRMQDHYGDPGVFIRSMATRGHLGGLAATSMDVAMLFDAAGMDDVLIETVGVGQDEIEVARIADVTVVVLVPGMGDDVQAIKAGIMEIADVYIINKADRAEADRLEHEIQFLLGLAPGAHGWVPPIVRTVATEGVGIPEALSAIESFFAADVNKERAVERWALRLADMLRERLTRKISAADLAGSAALVAARRKDPYTVIDEWIKGI